MTATTHRRDSQPDRAHERRREREQRRSQRRAGPRRRVAPAAARPQRSRPPGRPRPRAFYALAAAWAGRAPSAAARSSPRWTTATGIPAAWSRSSPGSGAGARPAKLAGSTKTSETPRRDSARCTSRSTSGASTREVTTTSSSDRATAPPAASSSAKAGVRRRRLGRREQLERARPVPRLRPDRPLLARGRVEDEDAAALPPHVREQDRPGGAHRHVEGRLRRLPGDRGGVTVEEHGDLVARRVLQLLHHQLPAVGGRAPVHLAQRLALLVLAHAVQLEPGRPAEQQPPSLLRVRAALGEQPLERRRAAGRRRAPAPRSGRSPCARARTGPRRTAGRSRPRSARAARAAARTRRRTVAGPPAPARSGARRAGPASRGRRASAAGPRTSAPPRARPGRRRPRAGRGPSPCRGDPRRPRRQPDPPEGCDDGEDEPGGDGIERARAEHPRDDVDEETEPENGAAARGHTGTGVRSSASATSASPSSPAERASGARISRCARTGAATAFTSSGTR